MEDKPENLDKLIANARQWQEFAGTKNSADCVLRKASVLARAIASEQASWDVESLQSSGVQFGIANDDRRWWDVYYDHLIYYVHIADREAFEFLGDTRAVFMDRLGTEVAGICGLQFRDDRQAAQFKATFFENLNIFQNEFGSYQRGRGVPLAEQLQYQFCKRIANRFDQDLAFAALAVIGITSGEILLNIPGLLIGQARIR